MKLNTTSQLPLAVVAGLAAIAGLGFGLWRLPAVHSRFWLPVGFALAIAAHVGIARGLKGLLSAVAPLASGAPEAAGYQRSVYGTPGKSTGQIVAAVLVAGVLTGFGITLGMGWVVAAGLAALAVALTLDVQRWERVATSADWVWFQRGFGQKVHQVAIENIRDISVDEDDAPGFTLPHGSRNRLCRLNLRMNDKRIVALPKTDAFADLEAVETVANHIRSRQDLMQELASRNKARGATPPPAPDTSADDADKAMQRALRRLRRDAAAASAPSPAAETRRPPKS